MVNYQNMKSECTKIHCRNIAGAIDGCDFFIIDEGSKMITQYDLEMNKVRCFGVSFEIHSLTYDQRRRCFWGISVEYENCLLRMNCDFKITQKIHLSNPTEMIGCLQAISFNLNKDLLVCAYVNGLCNYHIQTNIVECIYQTNKCDIYGVLSLDPSIMILAQSASNIDVTIFDAGMNICFKQHLPITYALQFVLFQEGECEAYFYAFYQDCQDLAKNKHVHVPFDSLPFMINEHCNIEEDPACHASKNIKERVIELLDCQQLEENQLCFQDSHAIMHAIALLETGLAHILNAEGEKIQRALCLSECIDDLLCVNASVQESITQITFLEQCLYQQLQLVDKLCTSEQSGTCCDCECQN